MARKTPGAAAPQPAAPTPDAPAVIETAAAPPAGEQPATPSATAAPEAPDGATDATADATTDVADAALAPAAPTPGADESTPDLDDFIAGHERAAQALDLVVTAISHPAAKPRHHQGVYSGFPITPGALSATFSDGSTH